MLVSPPPSCPAWQEMPSCRVDEALARLYRNALVHGDHEAIEGLQSLMGPTLLQSMPVGDKLGALLSLFLGLAAKTNEEEISSWSEERKYACYCLRETVEAAGMSFRSADENGFGLAHYIAGEVSIDTGGAGDACVDTLGVLLADSEFSASFWSRDNKEGRSGLALYLRSIGDCDRGALVALVAKMARDCPHNNDNTPSMDTSMDWYTWVVEQKMAGVDAPDALGYTLFECAAAVVDEHLLASAVGSRALSPRSHCVSHILDLWLDTGVAVHRGTCSEVSYLAGIGLDLDTPTQHGRLAGDLLVDALLAHDPKLHHPGVRTYAANNIAWILKHRPDLAPSLTQGENAASVTQAFVLKLQPFVSEQAALALYDAWARLSSDAVYRACSDLPNADEQPSPGPAL